MDERIRYLKKMGMLAILTPLKLLPMKKNRIILDNCLAHNYADNIKPITEYLIYHYPNQFELYVCVNDIKKYSYLKEKGITPIKFHSIQYYKIAMSSAFFITNSGGYSYLPLKKSQFVINTWHGGGAYKKIGIDSYSATPFYINELKLASKKTSIFLSTCKTATTTFSKALLIPEEKFWEIGMPRNDILINNGIIREKVRNKLELGKEDKLVLYAPTYRKVKDNTFGESIAIDYKIDAKSVCDALHKKFGGRWKFAIRLHPAIKKRNMSMDGDIWDLSEYEDMQELILACDAMINDFSSSMWDYLLTRKPGFTFASDLQHYVDTTAVYTPVEDWPFPKSTNNEELVQTIMDFNYEDYSKKIDEHYEKLGGCESGEASRYICEAIYKRLNA